MTMETMADRLREIRGSMAEAERKSGRAAGSVRLCAVSKTFPAEAVAEAMAAGQMLFGESRVQEAVAKIAALPAGAEWHFIGHLQSNKVRKILPLCRLFHAVDSLALAGDFSRIGGELGVTAAVLLQVNVARDGAKFGVDPDDAERVLAAMAVLPRLEVRGLMTIPALSRDGEEARGHFAALRELRDRLAGSMGVPLPELSMGMSGDFLEAIEEGATIVRVGSAIFGGR
jgi:pyridoxal phosphate enzyme (YggS family)